MRILVWLLRVAIFTVLVNLAWRLLVALLRTASGGGQTRPAGRTGERISERPGGALVRDPQCGTFVMQSRAIAGGSGDAAHYFCSDKCRTEYLTAHPQ